MFNVFTFAFYIALLDLCRQLEAIPHVRHALYRDDITIWLTQIPYVKFKILFKTTQTL